MFGILSATPITNLAFNLSNVLPGTCKYFSFQNGFDSNTSSGLIYVVARVTRYTMISHTPGAIK